MSHHKAKRGVPYEDSPLTRYLGGALQHSTIVACVSSQARVFAATAHALQAAARLSAPVPWLLAPPSPPHSA
eukprot:CAMPEP_0169454030 /NCGR_PEP_ID=MMETSP1042-20121227/15065_1 /TAXON_ID=464988 /ORGANISM="Hemiselmis andersenii, Strain CCMP1180" /LENGTH=71 /DNA_ID=CAMNT_0009566085 /DNA_START=36 /DNA_END=248 /DNA_ORIENTATION=-